MLLGLHKKGQMFMAGSDKEGKLKSIQRGVLSYYLLAAADAIATAAKKGTFAGICQD